MSQHDQMDRIIQMAAGDAEKAARIVARSFYKVLRRNGFSNDQIIDVANSMLDCLINSLDGYQQKSQLQSKEDSQETGVGALP
ncbi:MAG: hypothetical protein HY760_03020 [Nitrospirae bacterium]|nr:hypothetical protein [Nitrospirota bacterium]